MGVQEHRDDGFDDDVFDTAVVSSGEYSRVTIPKEVADAWDLDGGDRLIFEAAEGDAELSVRKVETVWQE
jgi:bifunctional DNA-binding transcriptional regulator/antitoxin component of YhaV-PrlF toxin-antitoxin module